MKNPLRPAVLVVAAAFACLLLAWAAAAQAPPGLPGPAPAGTRGPLDLEFSRDGALLYLIEQDENRVAVLEADSGKVLARIPTGGTQPTGLALSPDGKTLAVANHFSGSLGLVDTARRELRAAMPLPGGPWDVVITPGGEAFVSISQLDELAVVDLASAAVAARIPLDGQPREAPAWRFTSVGWGRRPRALTLTPDGATLLCACMSGGSVSVVDVTSRRQVGTVPLPAVNLRGIAVSADGSRAFVTGQRPHNDLPTARAEAMWDNLLFVLSVRGSDTRLASTISLDAADRGAADPFGATLPGSGGDAFVALSGTHEAAIVAWSSDASRPPAVSRRVLTGANPRALAARPAKNEIWVSNHLGNSLTVLNGAGEILRTLELEPPSKSDLKLRGRYLFTSAHLARGMRFTCNTCHPDGNTEGLSWRFAHLQDGIERRNSRNLRGSLLLTSPFRWVPREEDFEDFVNDEVVGLLRTRKLPHGQLHAFWELVNEMPLPPNPYRAASGDFTPAAARGRLLFAGKGGCRSCHAGGQYGGTGKSAWIGTSAPAVKLDVPHLPGVYDSAPYLHDGRAPTLESIFTDHNAARKHGQTHVLTPEELRNLVRFVREL